VGNVSIPDLDGSSSTSNLTIQFNRGANSDRKKYKQQIGELRTRHHSLQSEHEKLEKQKTALEYTATSTGELLSKCKKLTSRTDRVRPLVEAKLYLYQDLKITTDDFVAWTSELNNQAESMEILGRSDRVLENGMRRIVDALVDKEHAEVRKICAPLFAYATNPPPGTVATKSPQNPAEDRVGSAMAIVFVCIILFIQFDLVRLLWWSLLKRLLLPERQGVEHRL
jgi:hypothetical protein